MEVVRDKADNCIIVCSIENIDPMGVHTGDSITVAPALTLTDKEYQIMRNASIAVLREIGVETGGSNVQFAVNPENGRMIVIEMNPRVSRSSALASKATGFPDRQGRGQARRRLHARRDRQRHHRRRDAGLVRADHRLCRDQDSALRLREISRRRADPDDGDEIGRRGHGDRPHFRRIAAKGVALAGNRTDRPRRDRDRGARRRRRHERLARRARHADARPLAGRRAGAAHRHGPRARSTRPARSTIGSSRGSQEIVDLEGKVKRARPARRRRQSAHAEGRRLFRCAARLASAKCEAEVSALRRGLDVRPVFKRIDTCAAEFASPTAYMYSTYEPPFAGVAACEARPSDREKDRDPRRRPEPHRAGHRIRLLLLPRLFRAERAGYRNDHDQLQSGDGLDRLRHLGPALFRAADPRGRARNPRQGAGGRDAQGRDRAVRRPDAAEARQCAGRGRHSDPRHPRRFDRSRRGSRPVQAAARQARPEAAEERHRLFGRAVAHRRPRTRPAAGRASVLRAGRPGHGDHPRPERHSTIICSAPCRASCPPTSRRAIRTTRPARSIRCSARIRCCSTAICRTPSRSTSTALCDGDQVFVAGIMEHIEEAGIHSGDSACSLPPRSLLAAK